MGPADQRRAVPLSPSAARVGVAVAAWLAVASGPTTVFADDPPRFEAPRFLHEEPQGAAGPSRTLRSPFQPAAVSSRVRRLTLQFNALVEDEAWDEAIDLIERLASEHGDELLKAPSSQGDASTDPRYAGPIRYVPVATRCQQLLADLPPAGRQAYRDRVERSARRRLDDALVRLDEPAIARIADGYAATAAAADALLAQGELALERGDFAAARRCYTRLTPLASDPWGRPAAATLAALDPNADPDRLAEAWSAFPRPDDLMRVDGEGASHEAVALSRLALVSIRAGDLRRAEAELRLLRAVAPDAVGRLGGREQPLADALQEMLTASRVAPGGTSSDEPVVAWSWAWRTPVPSPLPGSLTQATSTGRQFIGRQVWANAAGRLIVDAPSITNNPEGPAAPTLQPYVAGDTAYFVDNQGLQRLDLATVEITRVYLPGESPSEPRQPAPAAVDLAARRAPRGVVIGGGMVRIDPRLGQGAVARSMIRRPRLQPSLLVEGGVLYGVLSSPVMANRRGVPLTGVPGEKLIGVDLEQPSNQVVEINTVRPKGERPVTPNATREFGFGGPPVVRGDRLFVPLARRGVRSDVAVACYELPSGRLRWRTELGSGEPIQLSLQPEPVALTLSGDAVYVATNLGATAALDAAEGRVRWIATYARRPGKPNSLIGMRQTTPVQKPLHRAFVFGDAVVAAPADSPRLLAWDAGSGRPLWDAPRPDPDAAIVGALNDGEGAVVVVAGERVASFDPLTGERHFLWPESRRSGLRGVGVAALVGAELFWPTRDALYAIDPRTGRFTRSPIDLSPIGGTGANLVATVRGLLVCGRDQVGLLGPADAPSPPPEEPTPLLSRRTETASRPAP